MDEWTLGLLVFAFFMGVTGLLMVAALRRNRAAGEPASPLQAVLPFLIAEGIFIVIFIGWLVSQV